MHLIDGEIVIQHSIYRQQNKFGGWPSIARTEGGELLVVFSGDRRRHIDPFGEILLVRSKDEGLSWSEPVFLSNTPLDDRDPGILVTPGGNWLLSFKTSKQFVDWQIEARQHYGLDEVDRWQPFIEGVTPDVCARYLGSFSRVSRDRGRYWGELQPAPVHAPHGPVINPLGGIFYLGKVEVDGEMIMACYRSKDLGGSWQFWGRVYPVEMVPGVHLTEPHFSFLPSGKMVALFATETRDGEPGVLFQSESEDGGMTWNRPHPTPLRGRAAHLMTHSSGALIAVYGTCTIPYGQWAAISFDEGQSWEYEVRLAEVDQDQWRQISMPDSMRYSPGACYPQPDLGYPASVELDDGSIFTVYYLSHPEEDGASILATRWKFPGSKAVSSV